MTTELSKSYDAAEVEPRWYAEWLAHGYFAARDSGNPAGAFTIMMPPPNITGSLHMGHALFCTLQDALTRLHRMRGDNALWLPGTDHAGIATQVVVERLLKLEGTDRHAVGRTKFLERVWHWKDESGQRIVEQLKVMGSSADWDRAKFTMDPALTRAVREAFVRLYEAGLIYRANRMVNWCVSCRSVISDLEVDRDENASGELFSFAYPFADGSGEIVVATTRPETILGDTAVAVHPDDPRYKAVIGKQLKAPFHDRTIPIIGDAILVDPKFGTGAVKVTPAHDFNDFETGKRYGLTELNILNLDGTLNAEGGPFAGTRPLPSAQGGEESARRERPRARRQVPSAGHRPVLAFGRRARADDLETMVGAHRAARQAGHRGGRDGPRDVYARGVDQDVHALDDQHPGLDDLASAVVGAPDSGVVLRKLQRRDGGARRPDAVLEVQRDESHARRRRARHLVFIGAMAFLYARMA